MGHNCIQHRNSIWSSEIPSWVLISHLEYFTIHFDAIHYHLISKHTVISMLGTILVNCGRKRRIRGKKWSFKGIQHTISQKDTIIRNLTTLMPQGRRKFWMNLYDASLTEIYHARQTIKVKEQLIKLRWWSCPGQSLSWCRSLQNWISQGEFHKIQRVENLWTTEDVL